MILNIVYILGYDISVGQNLAWGHPSWDAAIQAWFDEVNDFIFGQGKRLLRQGENKTEYNWLAVGHYTQVSKI